MIAGPRPHTVVVVLSRAFVIYPEAGVSTTSFSTWSAPKPERLSDRLRDEFRQRPSGYGPRLCEPQCCQSLLKHEVLAGADRPSGAAAGHRPTLHHLGNGEATDEQQLLPRTTAREYARPTESDLKMCPVELQWAIYAPTEVNPGQTTPRLALRAVRRPVRRLSWT